MLNQVVSKTLTRPVPGTDHGQRVYVLKCGRCDREYGANGSDIWLRRCPYCDPKGKGRDLLVPE